ncbi:MAG TPA: Gfo/Idh/MocA family oxidoreductase [Flavisolibacter sp.]|nr:Gfo/Idh/MocA family oxidoreductase [Flavisolibacter sp.]
MAVSGLGISLASPFSNLYATGRGVQKKRIGIIGLDTSHSIEFTKVLNNPEAKPELAGYKVVAAYPQGSTTIESSVKRIAGYTEEIKKYGVTIASSIHELLSEVDVVLLETNDGHPRLEQAMQVIRAGKPLFIDKPVAASLGDVLAIYAAAEKAKVPIFSSSSLRYITGAGEAALGKVGKVAGADVFGPAYLEKSHPDLFWYGIHGVEMLFTVMGKDCREVTRVHTETTDLVTGTWNDNRLGVFRGTRLGSYDFGGNVFGEKGTLALGPYTGYYPLLVQIIQFFETGIAPVSPEETIAIYAFMEAADESKRRSGATVQLQEVIRKAKKGGKA